MYKVLDVGMFNELVVSSLICDNIFVLFYSEEGEDFIFSIFVSGCNILFLILVVIYVY